MSTHYRNKVREIFADALEAPLDGVAAFLDVACKGDAGLRLEVESLLAAIARRPSFLSRPTGHAESGVGVESGEILGTRIGPYKLLEEIGRGGFGTVYLAEQEQPVRRRVALKIIRPGMDTSEVVARFEAERQALAMMDHPHIAQVLDAGASDSGRAYFVMELVRGESITAYADRHGLRIVDRLGLFVQVCQAVQHAHSKGVIHRDIKPGNVLVATQDGRPFAKVIDFGIAKATQQPLAERAVFTELRQLIGTPEYMSPEQAGGAPDADTRSDVYSLGTVLYELLTGVTPLDSKKLRAAAYDDMLRIIREAEPQAPSTQLSNTANLASVAALRRDQPGRLALHVSGDLDWIVMKAIEKDRSRRYQTAGALAEDVQRHLCGDPVLAAPPSMGYRVRKLIRRHRPLAAGVSAVAGVLVLGVIGTSLGLIAATRAKRELQQQAQRAEGEARRANEAEHAALRAKSLAEYDAYIANIESAYSALRFNDTKRLEARLEACAPELRHWEWRYLNAAGDASVLTLRHPARTLANLVHAAYSRDGSRLVSGNGDGTTWVWDCGTGEQLRALTGPEKVQGDLDVSPNNGLVLAAAMDAKIWVWDGGTGALVARLVGHKSAIRFAAFADDTRIVSASLDGTARVWDARSGRELRVMHHEGAINSAALSPDGTRLATACADKTVKAWAINEEGEPVVCRGHIATVLRVNWNAEGSRLVSASSDWTARVWDAKSGVPLASYRHGSRVLGAELSPNGKLAVSFAAQGDPCVWEAETGKELFALRGHSNSVLNARFNGGGTLILTSSRDTTVRLWDAKTGDEWSCLRGHTESPWDARFSPDGDRVMTTGDTTVRLWAIARDCEQNIVPAPLVDCAAMALCPNLRTLVEVGTGRFRLIDLETGQETRPFERLGTFGVCGVSPDGSTVLAAAAGNTVGAWDVREGRLKAPLSGHSGVVRAVAFRSDGARIVTASEDGTARVWDAGTGQELTVLRGHEGAVNDAAFDTSGGRIVTAGRDATVRVWNADTGALLRTMQWHDSSVNRACFSPDGARIVSASADFTARLWNASTGERLHLLRGHGHVVLDASFNPDGSRVATCSMDGTVRVWDAANGRHIVSMGGRSGGMIAVRFMGDGSRLFIGNTEGKAWLLDGVPARERPGAGSR